MNKRRVWRSGAVHEIIGRRLICREQRAIESDGKAMNRRDRKGYAKIARKRSSVLKMSKIVTGCKTVAYEFL
jgi:hypothetical protein